MKASVYRERIAIHAARNATGNVFRIAARNPLESFDLHAPLGSTRFSVPQCLGRALPNMLSEISNGPVAQVRVYRGRESSSTMAA